MKVLIVEDDPTASKALEKVLESRSSGILVSGSISGALNLCKSDTFDVILLDIGLTDSTPPMTLTYVKQIKDLQPKAAVVVVTGSGELRDDALRAGADGFVEKGQSGKESLLSSILRAIQSTGREDYKQFVKLLSRAANEP